MKKLIGLVVVFMLLGLSSVFAQSKTVTGTVVDLSGMGLPGVSVSIKGTTVGASTDIDGKWSLETSADDILEFSFVGMKTQEVKVGNKTVINVTLEEDRVAVEEVMVVGYGTAKKSSFTGSASVVKSDQIKRTPTVSLAKALQATSPGVMVSSSSGAAGADATIRIRGIGSLASGSDPLWVVDGVVDAPKPHIEDIESMTVLKDAAAASIYGSRAANGVIVVSTKSGKVGRTQFDFQAKYSVSNKTTNKFKLLNSAEFYKVSWDGLYAAAIKSGKNEADAAAYAHANLVAKAGKNPYDVAQPFDNNGNLVDNANLMLDEDWNDLVNRTGVTQQYDLSAAGGNDKTKFYFSLGYFDQEGIIKPDMYSKYTGQVNVTNKVSEKLKIGFRSSFKRTSSNGLSGTSNASSTGYAAYTLPNNVSLYELDDNFQPVKDADGNYKYNWDNKVSQNYNPIGLANLNNYYSTGTYFFSSFNMNFEILKGLVFDTKFSGRYNSKTTNDFETGEYGDGLADKGRSEKTSYESLKYMSSSTLTYDKTFDELHHVNVLLGYEFEDYKYKYLEAVAKEYEFNFSDELDVAAKPKSVDSDTYQDRMIGMFSRINYDYDNKYYLSGSIRRDASSRFSPDNRWGTFWSVSGSWRLSQEDFIQSIDFIDNLKLNASYGTNGVAGIGRYLYMPLYSLGGNYNDIAGIVHSQLSNKDLKWEKSGMANVGLEFGLFGCISGTLEWFTKKSEDMLMNRPLAYSTGWNERIENIGAMKNSGIEFALNTVNIKSEDFEWTTNFNITFSKTELTALSQDEIQSPDNYWGRVWRVGTDPYTWYLKEWAGVDRETGEAQWWKDVKDADGNVTSREKTKDYSSADYYELGSSIPDFYGGLSNTFTYKNFTLGVQMNYSVGGKIYDNLEQTTMNDGASFGYQLNAKVLDAWRPDNKDSDIPQYIYNNTSKSNASSSRYLYDGSYLRIKNISLSYDFDKSDARKVGLQSARLFVNAENLYTFTNYEGLDPEQGVSGRNGFGTIPNVRTFTFGVRLGF